MSNSVFARLTFTVVLFATPFVMAGCGQSEPDVPTDAVGKIKAIENDSSLSAEKKETLKAQVSETEATRDRVLQMNRRKIQVPTSSSQTPPTQ
jgi:hypothetical protein